MEMGREWESPSCVARKRSKEWRGWRRALSVRLLWEIVLVGFGDFRKLMSPYCLSVIAPVMLMLTVSWVKIAGVISSFK
jgi:hypothetical protein